jgi:hypothetical protein
MEIGTDRVLPAPSVAMTVTTLTPVAKLTLRLQFAALLPVAVPPVAAAPLIVTLEIPLPPLPLSVAEPANVMLDVVTVWPGEWLVMVSVGAVVSDVPDGCTVHPNDRVVVARPSVTNTVTTNVPVVVGVPLITPVLELRLNPKGNPVWLNRRVPPSGSLATSVIGAIGWLTMLVWVDGTVRPGIETLTSEEYAPGPAALMARTAT